jgi:hypothetical protein
MMKCWLWLIFPMEVKLHKHYWPKCFRSLLFSNLTRGIRSCPLWWPAPRDLSYCPRAVRARIWFFSVSAKFLTGKVSQNLAIPRIICPKLHFHCGWILMTLCVEKSHRKGRLDDCLFWHHPFPAYWSLPSFTCSLPSNTYVLPAITCGFMQR